MPPLHATTSIRACAHGPSQQQQGQKASKQKAGASPPPQQQQQQQQQQRRAARPRPQAPAGQLRHAAAYSVAPPTRSGGVVEQRESSSTGPQQVWPVVQPLLDDPALWPAEQQLDDEAGSAPAAPLPPRGHQHAAGNLLRLPAASTQRLPLPPPGDSSPLAASTQHTTRRPHYPSLPAAAVGGGLHQQQQQKKQQAHRHPPIAPEDPSELLQVLQVMDPPRRRLVVFKGGGYVYADMEALIQAAGLGHVLRLTNLVRKAHCIVAKEQRDTGKRVNLSEHIAAARNANIPFLLIDRLEPEQLVGLLRPLLLRKRIVTEHPQQRRARSRQAVVGESGADRGGRR